jgi:hypothetical protein
MMGRYAEAFAAYGAGKRTLRKMSGQGYLADEARGLVERLRGFFTSSRLQILPRERAQRHRAADLHRQLSPLRHHDGRADADRASIPRMLNSPLPYPEAFADLWLGDQVEGLERFPQKASRRGFS